MVNIKGWVMANINGPGAGTARNVAWDKDSRGNGTGGGSAVKSNARGGLACGAGSILANGTGVGFGDGPGAGGGLDIGSERGW